MGGGIVRPAFGAFYRKWVIRQPLIRYSTVIAFYGNQYFFFFVCARFYGCNFAHQSIHAFIIHFQRLVVQHCFPADWAPYIFLHPFVPARNVDCVAARKRCRRFTRCKQIIKADTAIRIEHFSAAFVVISQF